MTDRKHTPGLARALSKRKDREKCDCGFTMPVYPGMYPKTCPECGKARTPGPGKEESRGEGTAAA